MKEWYLIKSNTRPNLIGGYENQSFLDYKDDAFSESLDTDLADTVILYNYDLSKSKVIKGIIQGNTADTQLKSLERTILFPIGTVLAGMYVFFENCYWLVNGYPSSNKFYEKATLVLCQYLLKWQNENGDIIERWVNLTSASKYDVGESGDKTMIFTSNNYTVLIPNDDESMELEGKRVFIDRSRTNPIKVFKITRNDDTLYDYGGHGGILSLIADKTEFNPETDNQALRICNYVAPTLLSDLSNSNIITSQIIGRTNLKIGFPRTYSVEFKHENVCNICLSSHKFEWKINSPIADKLTISYSMDNFQITILATDKQLIGKSFILQVVINSEVSSAITIHIEDLF